MFFTVSWDTGKLVTLSSLLLLIFSQILAKEAVSPTLMDMALHSFDDQYLGCREEMMEELERGDYFQKEIAANKDYLCLWKKAQEALLKSPVGLLREMRDSHATVLMAYTMNSSLHSQLNWATSTAGISPEHYRHNFSFKYYHFYLTTAIQILKEWQISMGEPKCYQVHRGVKDLYIEAKLQEARTVVILHLPLPFSLVCLEFPCAWPTISDSLAASRYVPLNSRQEASGVPAATEGSIFPLLSAAILQPKLEHSAWFIKTDIPGSNSVCIRRCVKQCILLAEIQAYF
ncbi:single-pass membrane and coiled-coil domain-containing protein 3 isoform X3 [Vidua chalybeata]|uniref:single-pass membrane and coiled-coil domain-containing protein 3 isoform X3 n=1 Tax=Vidua chalybeata TaxID=81927 RepID=UPI0023A82EA6|nr:single-pass membrane and coiled-coil domain-containing protein 3 isoform X3 [Vidua chalybeata]